VTRGAASLRGGPGKHLKLPEHFSGVHAHKRCVRLKALPRNVSWLCWLEQA
jgi:hypothetical protein